jgi:PadR family transcriptional regulator, regulatory protein AphA
VKGDLTTTSFAVLGLLNLRSWTAYELAAEMEHCFGYFWPRAESRTYAEADRLVEAGLATKRREYLGRRPRSTYAITPAGRRALRRWLGQPFKALSIDFEGLVRVFLARAGDRNQLGATLDQVEREADELLGFASQAAGAYYACQAPFQAEEGHLRAFVFTFMVPFANVMKTWAQQTRAEIATWEDLSSEGKGDRAIELIRTAVGQASGPRQGR